MIEFTTTGRSDYPKGIDIQTARNWIVRHNLFRNIVAAGGALSGPGRARVARVEQHAG